MRVVFEQLSTALAEKHAQVRLAAAQLIHELFGRSHLFRTLLVQDLRRYIELAVGVDEIENPLPPPQRCPRGARPST